MPFDPFGDFEERGYLRNAAGFADRRDVAELEHRSFLTNLPRALANLAGRRRLGYADLLETHATLFADVYPSWAGRDRRETAPGVAVTKGGRDDLFAHPLETGLAGAYAMDRAQAPGRMRAAPGEVMGLLAHAHPFLDGNGRTITTMHTELARRAGFAIDWTRSVKGDYLAALTAELIDPRERALDAYLAPLVVEVPRGMGVVEALAAVDGLNPPGRGRGATGGGSTPTGTPVTDLRSSPADVPGARPRHRWMRLAPTRSDLAAAIAARSGGSGPRAAVGLGTPTARFLAMAGEGVSTPEHRKVKGGCERTGAILVGDAALVHLEAGFGRGERRRLDATPDVEGERLAATTGSRRTEGLERAWRGAVEEAREDAVRRLGRGIDEDGARPPRRGGRGGASR